MLKICFSSIKGGTGKSTLSILLSRYLASTGKRILCIDLDIQNSQTFYYLDDSKIIENKNIALALQSGNIIENISKTSTQNIDIIPSSFSLVNLRAISPKTLSRVISQINDDYDFVIIDTAPTWDNISLNGIIASDYIISPVRLAQFDFKGANFYKNQIAMDTGQIENWYILINFFKSPRTKNPENLTNQYLSLFQSEFSNILDCMIPDTKLAQKSIDTLEVISHAKDKMKLFSAIEMLANLFLSKHEFTDKGRF